MNPFAIAKINSPSPPEGLLRQRLFRLIDSPPLRPIMWICGPAGSGKTTLAASYLSFQQHRNLWYQVDAGDADIATFFHYLGLASQNAAPRPPQLPIFSPEYLEEITVFARRYFIELFAAVADNRDGDSAADNPYFLTIDNYQDVPPEAPLHEALAAGLDALPTGIRVIVISREEPPRQYTRLRANGRIAMIGWSDLRFTREESSALLTHHYQVKHSAGDLDLLYARSQGWAAGLVLFNESLHIDNTALSFPEESPPHEEIFEYFAEEVYRHLATDIRSFLIKTAFLPQITPQCAGIIAETEQAAAILSTLSRRNCFTERRILPQLTYQYHPLFREFLLTKAATLFSAPAIVRLQRQAAQLLEKNGRIEDAVALLLDGDDWDELVPILAANIPLLLAQGRAKTVQEWLHKIPEKIRIQNTILTYYLGICRMHLDPAAALALLETSFREACQQGNDALALTSWSDAVITILHGWNDFTILDNWIAWLEIRVEREPPLPAGKIEAKVAVSMAGALIFRRPDQPAMIRPWLNRALQLSRETADANLQAQIICYALQYYSSLGDTINTEVILLELRSIPSAAITSPTAVITLKWIEAVSCNWRLANPEAGLRLINEGLDFAKANGLSSGNDVLFAVGAYCALLKGDLARAGDFIRRIEKTLNRNRFHSFCQYNYITAFYQLLQGDVPAAQRHAEIALQYASETGIFFPVLFCRLALAHITLESGDYQQAGEHLDLVAEPLTKSESGILTYSFELARARLALATGKKAEGLFFLRQALQLARKNGYTWLFWWWHPASMARLCAIALEAGIEVTYTQKIIRTCRLKPAARAVISDTWPYPLQITTLGRFGIIQDGQPLLFSGKEPRKPLEMLKALIAFGGDNVREEQISEALWPEADGDAAHKSFEVCLVRLRKLVGGQQAIRCQGGLVSIKAGWCRVDALVLADILEEAEKSWLHADHRPAAALPADHFGQAVHKAEGAVNIYNGDFLPAETHQAWAISYRERLRNRTIQLLARLAAHWQRTGALEKTLACYQRGLEIDALREEFYQQLMVCQQQLGRHAEAVITYQRCHQALSADLGIRPSPTTEGIFRTITTS